jgi:short-chain fatty acids transporter
MNNTQQPLRLKEEALLEVTAESWLARFSQVMGRIVPDAISTSIFLMIILFLSALAIGNSLTSTMDAYYQGLWMLLPFTMQMTLLLALSGVLGSTSLFRTIIVSLSRIPKTSHQVFGYCIMLAAIFSYCYWALGVALTPIIAIHFAGEAERKGIAIDFPFLLAATWAANSVWQYGLSSSAPLLMAAPGHFLETTTGVMSLGSTIGSPAAITQVLGFLAALICTARLLMPKTPQPLSQFPDAHKIAEFSQTATGAPNTEQQHSNRPTYAERIERTVLLPAVLCVALAGWLIYHFGIKHASLDFNSLNTTLLLLCFLLHRSVDRFSKALQQAIVSCWPIIVMYHLYAGVAGLIQFTTVGESFASLFASVSTRYTFPCLTALAGTVVAVFVPSSGGQWVIQGYVTSKAAETVGVTAQRGLLSLGIGDQMGNLVSPFWYMVTAEIARIDFRTYYGYSLLFAALWFVIGSIVFTFLPC